MLPRNIMLKPSDQFMLLNRSVQPFPDVMPDRSRLFKMAGIVRFRPFLHDVMTLGIIKPSGSFKTQMHFGTSFNALFFQRPAVNEAPFKAMLSHMFVVLHLPAFSQFPHRLFLAAGLLIEAGLVDTKTGELCYKKDRILQALKELKYDLETSPNPDA